MEMADNVEGTAQEDSPNLLFLCFYLLGRSSTHFCWTVAGWTGVVDRLHPRAGLELVTLCFPVYHTNTATEPLFVLLALYMSFLNGWKWGDDGHA